MLKFTTLRLMMGHFLCFLETFHFPPSSPPSPHLYLHHFHSVGFGFTFNCSIHAMYNNVYARCSFGFILFAIKIEVESNEDVSMAIAGVYIGIKIGEQINGSHVGIYYCINGLDHRSLRRMDAPAMNMNTRTG